MDTASGQADAPATRAARPRRRRRLNPLAIGILALFVVLALAVMGLTRLIYPPTAQEPAKTVADTWKASRTATPATLHTDLLKVEKLGPAQKQNDQVIVHLRVTNNVVQSAAVSGTPTPDAATPTPSQAEVYNGIIRVFFYKTDDKGNQQTVGSGLGNVTNLKFGQSQDITVVATGVGDFTDYVAFPESVWTDKDPVKPTEAPAGTPVP